MKRNEIIESSIQDKLKHCIAFHEAGYATAIYLNIESGVNKTTYKTLT